MRTHPSKYTIFELDEQIKRGDLVVNREYQREAGVWPPQAKSYFLETILEGYPFPKCYFYETFDRAKQKVKREIVDGQQRINTIIGFRRGEFRITGASRSYAGMTFEGLPEERQEEFLRYSVDVDVILSAERADLLEMFRRINAYTAPLNPAEKRHADFFGEFKWFITDIADKHSPVLIDYGVITPKQAVRMQDVEFLAELCLVLDRGLVNKSEQSFRAIYRKFDTSFDESTMYEQRLDEFFELISSDFEPLQDTFLIKKGYSLHSLFCALMYNKYGLALGIEDAPEPAGHFYTDLERTIRNLGALADAQEAQDVEGPHGEYVKACMSTTHRVAQRRTRTKAMLAALA